MLKLILLCNDEYRVLLYMDSLIHANAYMSIEVLTNKPEDQNHSQNVTSDEFIDYIVGRYVNNISDDDDSD